MTKKRRTFLPEFKREAVRQLESGETTASELARKLGIPRNRLYKWKDSLDRLGDNAFSGKLGRPRGSVSGSQANASLKAEVERLRQENEILKKAAAFFARELT
jgi:transposase